MSWCPFTCRYETVAVFAVEEDNDSGKYKNTQSTCTACEALTFMMYRFEFAAEGVLSYLNEGLSCFGTALKFRFKIVCTNILFGASVSKAFASCACICLTVCFGHLCVAKI